MDSYGKQKCETLKEIRKRIANILSLDYEPLECTETDCTHGICPRCQQETDWLLEYVINYCYTNNISLEDFFRKIDYNSMMKIKGCTKFPEIKNIHLTPPKQLCGAPAPPDKHKIKDIQSIIDGLKKK